MYLNTDNHIMKYSEDVANDIVLVDSISNWQITCSWEKFWQRKNSNFLPVTFMCDFI